MPPNNISAFRSGSDCFHFLLAVVLVHRLLWTCWYIKIIPQFFLFLTPPFGESFPFPKRHKDQCGPWARRYRTAVPGREGQDGAGKAGNYLICYFHLVQGLGQSGLVDKALVAWVTSWLPAPRQAALCASPSLYQEHFQADDYHEYLLLTSVRSIFRRIIITNIYCYSQCAGCYYVPLIIPGHRWDLFSPLGWDRVGSHPETPERATESTSDSITNIFCEWLVIVSAAVSEHPPGARSSHAPLPAREQAQRGKGELCSSSHSAHPPGGKDQAQSWAPRPFLLPFDRGDTVVALGGSRNVSCVSWKGHRTSTCTGLCSQTWAALKKQSQTHLEWAGMCHVSPERDTGLLHALVCASKA